LTWAAEIAKWLSLPSSHVEVLMTSSSSQFAAPVTVVSYDLLTRMAEV
jgi:hypothetical protein